MKKLTIIIALALMVQASLTQAQTTSESNKTDALKYTLDSTSSYYWDTISNSYICKIKSVHTNDASGNVVYRLNTTLSNGNWVNSSQQFFTYDANNNRTSFISQLWDKTNNIWTGFIKTLYTYNGNNKLITNEALLWNKTTSSFDTQNIDSFFYNTDGTASLTMVYSWNKSSASFYCRSRIYYTYNASQQELTNTSENWDTLTSTWVGNRIYTSRYANNKLSEYIIELWDTKSKSYVTYGKTIYYYDANNNTNRATYMPWNKTTNSYVNQYDDVYGASSDSLLRYRAERIWRNNVYVFMDSACSYYHSDITNSAINNIYNNAENLNIYPNPASHIINIQHTSKQKELLTIYNALGEQVYTANWLPNQMQTTIDVSELKAGMYVLRVGDLTRKILVR